MTGCRIHPTIRVTDESLSDSYSLANSRLHTVGGQSTLFSVTEYMRI